MLFEAGGTGDNMLVITAMIAAIDSENTA